MDFLFRFLLVRIKLQIFMFVVIASILAFSHLIGVEPVKQGNKIYLVRRSANLFPPWVSVAAFVAVTGGAFVALFLVSGRKNPPTPPTPAQALTEAFPTQIRKERDRDIDRALAIKPRPPAKKDSA